MRPTRITTAEETVTHHIAIKGVQRAALLGILAVALAVPAAAHHPLGGGTPMTAWHGFLSGIGHPVIGFDHLAFVVAVGIASAFVGLRYFAPAIFIAATVVGCLLALAIGPMAQLEMMISASVALIGIMLLSGRTFPSAGYMALFAVAGVLHGGAYAGAVVGAEATPIGAYLIGFGFIQYAIAAAITFVTLQTWNAVSAAELKPRLAGAFIAGIGMTFLIEHIEALAFPGM